MSAKEVISHPWPMKEATRLWESLGKKLPPKGYVLFATGYGPSGLPHIGTFGEVVRTSMVRTAFEHLTHAPTKLYLFSDDMDALRKVPANIPQQDLMTQHLGEPLSAIPDPFGTHESYAAHNNALLRKFLDRFSINYELMSATQLYKSGRYDAMLLQLLSCHEAVCDVVRPVLGEERRANYSPFLPICPKTGRVLETKIIATDETKGTITYHDEDSHDAVTVSVTGGNTKLQWRADWAMRWAAMDVDYEMAGKDLTDSLHLSAKITRLLKKKPPLSFIYELFLDEKGEKISKSKGNGISMDEWLRYAPQDSLRFFMYQHPRRAKRLFFDVIPRMTDAWLEAIQKYGDETEEQKLQNPIFYIHDKNPPIVTIMPAFSMILNLASACNAEQKSVLWEFIRRYNSSLREGNNQILDSLVECAMNYYHDFIHPQKRYLIPDDSIRLCLQKMKQTLTSLEEVDAKTIQNCLYDTSRLCGYDNTKDWFKMLYQTLLGQEQGPRMGSFIAFYGVKKTIDLIDLSLARLPADGS